MAKNFDLGEISAIKNSGIDFQQLLIAAADCIYARRCDEHVLVLGDCPKANEDDAEIFTRPIPPYCGKWCDLMNEPTASLKE